MVVGFLVWKLLVRMVVWWNNGSLCHLRGFDFRQGIVQFSSKTFQIDFSENKYTDGDSKTQPVTTQAIKTKNHALPNKLSSLKGLFQDVIEKIDYDTSGR